MAEPSGDIEAIADRIGQKGYSAALQSEHLVPRLTAGLVAGALGVIWSISYAVLIFSGALAPHLGQGLALGLVSVVVLNLAALGSSFPSVIARPQGQYAVIVAGMAGAIAAQAGVRTGAHLFPTVLALIALTTLGTGLFFLVLGAFHLGRLVRYVPFPVFGGFLAGTGWLIAAGAVGVLINRPLTRSTLHLLTGSTEMVHLLAGVAVAVALPLILWRFSHFLVMPVVLVLLCVLFYAVLLLTGTPVSHAEAHGWLLGPFPGGSTYRPLMPDQLGEVDWSALGSQVGGMITVVIVSAVGLMLNVTGLEAATGADLDVDRELAVIGIGNVVSGIGSGFSGFHSLSTSLAAEKVGSRGRLVSLVAAAVGVLALAGGTSGIAYIPRFVVGGLLLYIGADLLFRWVYQSRITMSRLDYATVLIILAVIVTFGFLQGLVVGIALGIVLFVITYSRTGVVKYQLRGTTYRSNVDRSERQEQVLRERGNRLHILVLQGFLFFGTSNSLLERIRRLVSDEAEQQPRYIVLDCRGVSGVDASVPLIFTKLRQLAERNGITIVLTSLAPGVRQTFERAGLLNSDARGFTVYPNLDQGVEWCEDRILDSAQALARDTRPLVEQLSDLLPSPEMAVRLVRHMDRREMQGGAPVVVQGDLSNAVYMVESGEMSVVLERRDGTNLRLRTLAAGSLIGEIGFFLGTPRTASVIATEPSVVYGLSWRTLNEIEETDPLLALAFTELITRLLAERLTSSTETVAALMR